MFGGSVNIPEGSVIFAFYTSCTSCPALF
jgi:hypothetical protein